VGDIVTAVGDDDYDLAWALIEAHAYLWTEAMLDQDYYFLGLWAEYQTDVITPAVAAAASYSAAYGAYDVDAWIADAQWSALLSEDDWPLNIQVITSIVTEGHFHYYFGQANVGLSTILRAFSYFPSFCGEVYGDADLGETCRQELALFLTYVRFDGTQALWGSAAAGFDVSENAEGEAYEVSDRA